MTFSQVSLRLRALKHEIRDLRLLDLVDIQDKIQNLKKINQLLKEQNRLLLVRQDYLNQNYLISSNFQPGFQLFVKERLKDKVA